MGGCKEKYLSFYTKYSLLTASQSTAWVHLEGFVNEICQTLHVLSESGMEDRRFFRHLGRNRFISTKHNCFHSASYSLVWLKRPTLSRVISSTILLLGFNLEFFSNVLTVLLETVARKQFWVQKWELQDIILSSNTWEVSSQHFTKQTSFY